MRAACTRKHKCIYYILLYGQQDKSLVYRIHNKIYDCDNGGFVVKQGYYTFISPRCTDNKTDEKTYTFKIENRSPNINVYLFLGVDIFKTVRSRYRLRMRWLGKGCARRFNFRCRDKICVDVFDSSRPTVAATAFVVDNNCCWPNYH